jgi:hypothetical protein
MDDLGFSPNDIGRQRRLCKNQEELRTRWNELAVKLGWFEAHRFEGDVGYVGDGGYVHEIVLEFGLPPYEFLDETSIAPKKLLNFSRHVIVNENYRAQRPGPNYSSFGRATHRDDLGREYGSLHGKTMQEMWYRRPIKLIKLGVEHPEPGERIKLTSVKDGSFVIAIIQDTHIMPRAATGLLTFSHVSVSSAPVTVAPRRAVRRRRQPAKRAAPYKMPTPPSRVAPMRPKTVKKPLPPPAESGPSTILAEE